MRVGDYEPRRGGLILAKKTECSQGLACHFAAQQARCMTNPELKLTEEGLRLPLVGVILRGRDHEKPTSAARPLVFFMRVLACPCGADSVRVEKVRITPPVGRRDP